MGEEKNENVNTAPEQPQPDRAANAQPVEEETETPRAKILGRKENGKVDVKQTAENLKNEFLAMKRRSRIMSCDPIFCD